MKWDNIKESIERAGIRDDDRIAQINFLYKSHIDRLAPGTNLLKFHVIERGNLYVLHQVADPNSSAFAKGLTTA